MAVVATKQGHVTVDSRVLHIVCSQFSDRILLVITERQKLGTLMEVVRDPVVDTSRSCTFSIRTLLGKDQPQIHVFGRALASHVLPPSVHHLLLCLDLTDHSPKLLPTLITHVQKYSFN